MDVSHPGSVSYTGLTRPERISRSAVGCAHTGQPRVTWQQPARRSGIGCEKRTREGGKQLSIKLVARADLDLGQLVEHVELGEVEARVAVDEVRVADDDQVEPSAAAAPAGGDAILDADFLEVIPSGLYTHECELVRPERQPTATLAGLGHAHLEAR